LKAPKNWENECESMSKEETIHEILGRIVDVEVPKVMDMILKDEKLKPEEKATLLSLLDMGLHHLRLTQARLKPP